ncbi:MAG: hypothetical protein AAFR14_08140, partial [Bacteroidota bacterium]
YGYRLDDPRQLQLIFIMAFFILVLFPLLSTLLFSALDLVPSIHLPKREHRIGPLIATTLFYIWFFVNVKGNVSLPDTLVYVSLGSAISVGLAFFMNNFSKISLHAVGAGSLLMGMIVLVFHQELSHFEFVISAVEVYRVSSIFALFLAIILSGLIGTSRLVTGAHRPNDVGGGFVVGIISQLAAYNIIY